MGIKFGGGAGLPFGRPKPSPLQPIKPFSPIQDEIPVPVEKKLRLGVFFLLEERDDYLICKGYDPNGSGSVRRKIKVAKPWLLQKTRWHGQTVPLIVGGRTVPVTFEYTGLGKRIARATVVSDDGEEEEVEETQRITMDYFAGDAILAARVRQDAQREGFALSERLARPGRRLWLDLNMSGRCWAVSEDE